jgi:hypothetical protein
MRTLAHNEISPATLDAMRQDIDAMRQKLSHMYTLLPPEVDQANHLIHVALNQLGAAFNVVSHEVRDYNVSNNP